MSDYFKNKTINLNKKNTITNILTGGSTYSCNIKSIKITNKKDINSFVSLFVKSKDKKIYIIKNVTIPQRSIFEVPLDKNIIILNYEDILCAESINDCDLDIICNYIEKKTQIGKIQIQFKDTKSKIVTGITWVEDSTNTKRRIDFSETTQYSEIPSLYYEIKDNYLIVYKNGSIQINPDYNYKEFNDRFEIYLTKNIISNLSLLDVGLINITTNIYNKLTDSPKWRYSVTDTFTDSNIWNSINKDITITPGDYTLELEDFDNYIKPEQFSFNILRNNLLNLHFDYSSSLCKVNVKTSYDEPNLIWSILELTGQKITNNNNIETSVYVPENLYYVEIETSVDKTLYLIDTLPDISLTLNHIDDVILPKISVIIDNNNIDDNLLKWQLNNEEIPDENKWNENNKKLSISEGTYFLIFKNIDGYTPPTVETLKLRKNCEYEIIRKHITNKGSLNILKPTLIPDDIENGIKWRLLDISLNPLTDWLNHNSIATEIDSGEYYIQIQGLENYFENIQEKVIIYGNQKTTYIIDNSILLF